MASIMTLFHLKVFSRLELGMGRSVRSEVTGPIIEEGRTEAKDIGSSFDVVEEESVNEGMEEGTG